MASDWPGQDHIFTLETEGKSAYPILMNRVKEIENKRMNARQIRLNMYSVSLQSAVWRARGVLPY